MCEIHTIEKIRLVPCDRIRPITLLWDIPHPDMWGDARSQQKSETVAITYNHHRCKRHFIFLFPCSWAQENFPTTRKREITSLLGLSLGDATSQAISAKSCLRLFWELSTNSRTTHFWSVTGRIVHGGLNYMNHDDNQRPVTHLNCGYAFLVSLLTPNDYLCFNFIICRIVAEKVGILLNTWKIIILPQPRENSDRCMAHCLGSSITHTFEFG